MQTGMPSDEIQSRFFIFDNERYNEALGKVLLDISCEGIKRPLTKQTKDIKTR